MNTANQEEIAFKKFGMSMHPEALAEIDEEGKADTPPRRRYNRSAFIATLCMEALEARAKKRAAKDGPATESLEQELRRPSRTPRQ